MNSNKKAVIKVVDSKTNIIYKVFSILNGDNNNGIVLDILCNSSAWNGEVNEEQLQEAAKKHQTSLDSYRTTLNKYLQEVDTTGDILYEITKEKFTIWKKFGKIKSQYFFVNLKLSDFYDAAHKMIDSLSDWTVQLNKQITDLNMTVQDSSNLKEESIKKLDEFIGLQHKKEHKLYSSFVLLLNEKKKHIQHLNSTIERLTFEKPPKAIDEMYTTDEENLLEIASDGDQTPPKKFEKVSDSEEDTDDENQSTMDLHKPSTSKKGITLLLSDDSSSPPPVLIKKLKTDGSPNKSSMNVSNISNNNVNETAIMSNKEEIIEIKSNALNTDDDEEESPTLDFSTQDLLNRL